MDAADREDKEVDRSNPGVLRRQGVGEVSTNEGRHPHFSCKYRRGILRRSGPGFDETCSVSDGVTECFNSVIYTILAGHAVRAFKWSETSSWEAQIRFDRTAEKLHLLRVAM
jgi:hypothetical protein